MFEDASLVRCPRCRNCFSTPSDEVGDHDCPNCGFGRDTEGPDINPEDGSETSTQF